MFNPFVNDDVKHIFSNYPKDVKPKLLFLRELIFDTAKQTKGVGEIEETLKWDEPSYLTSISKSGSTIRIDWKPKTPKQYAMYFNCRTTLIPTFKEIYGDTFKYEGNRSLIFLLNETLPVDALSDCISMALTYHQIKGKR